MNGLLRVCLMTVISICMVIDEATGCVRTDHDGTCRDTEMCSPGQSDPSLPRKGACMCMKKDNVKVKTQVCGDTQLLASKSSNQCFIYKGIHKTCNKKGVPVKHLLVDFYGENYMIGRGYLLENPYGCSQTSNGGGGSSDFRIIPRNEWGAEKPKEITKLNTPLSHVVIHHTAGYRLLSFYTFCDDMDSCKKKVKRIQKEHMQDRGWDDIGYNFIVGEDGNAYEGRGWENRGSHAPGCNSKSYAITVIGNYKGRQPNDKALKAVESVITMGINKGYIMSGYEIHGHRSSNYPTTDTVCPGDKLYEWVARKPNFNEHLVCQITIFSIIPRDKWDAAKPERTTSLSKPLSHVVIHHTSDSTHACVDETSCKNKVKSIQDAHIKTKGWDDIKYNFIVGEDGNAYEGRGWKYRGDHTPGCDSLSFGIAVMGNFQDRLPNLKALDAIESIIDIGIDKGFIKAGYESHGHRNSNNDKIVCPGDQLYEWVSSTPNFKDNLECKAFIPRDEWGAKAANKPTKLDTNTPLSHVVIHHTASPPCSDLDSCKKRIKVIQTYHMDTKKWNDIAYNFLIGEDGNVYEGRGWNNQGAHAPGCNSKSYGISVVGNFVKIAPNDKALVAIKDIIASGVERGNITSDYKIHGHRNSDNSKTVCPGDKLYDWVKKRVHFDEKLSCK